MSCPDCFRGAAATATPSGTTSTLHGIRTYTASPTPPNTTSPNSAIILYTDAFGHALPNNLLLADALASSLKTTVHVPDLIPGGPMSPSILPLMDTFTSPSSSYAAKALALCKAMPHIIPFFARASPQSATCTTPCTAFARAVKQNLAPGATLGLAGYCWGGYQALHIAGLAEKLADAVFVAHPARFETGHVVDALEKGVRVSFAHAGQDMSLSNARVEGMCAVVGERDGWEIRVYEGCGHGFAVRAVPGKEVEVRAAEEALRQGVEWFAKWL